MIWIFYLQHVAGKQDVKPVEIERSGTGIEWVVKNEIKYKGILDSFNSFVMGASGTGGWLSVEHKHPDGTSAIFPYPSHLQFKYTRHMPPPRVRKVLKLGSRV